MGTFLHRIRQDLCGKTVMIMTEGVQKKLVLILYSESQVYTYRIRYSIIKMLTIADRISRMTGSMPCST